MTAATDEAAEGQPGRRELVEALQEAQMHMPMTGPGADVGDRIIALLARIPT